MDRRKFLVGLGSASVGGSALIGSGAFSRVEAQRSVTIEVAEDPDAYLGLDKCRYPDYEGEHVPNGSYAHLDDHGHLEILMNEDNPHHPDDDLGAGVNSESQTWFHNVFQICNQGKDTVCVHIEEFETLENDPDYGPTVDFYLGDDDERSIVGEENHFELEVGDCRCVGIKTVTKGLSDGDELIVDDDITIVADVDCPNDEPECAHLEANYSCSEWRADDPNAEESSIVFDATRFAVTNLGTRTTDYGMAVQNEEDEFREIGDTSGLRNLSPGETKTPIVNALRVKSGFVFWEDDETCDCTRARDVGFPEEEPFMQIPDDACVSEITDIPGEDLEDGAWPGTVDDEEELDDALAEYEGVEVCREAEARETLPENS